MERVPGLRLFRIPTQRMHQKTWWKRKDFFSIPESKCHNSDIMSKAATQVRKECPESFGIQDHLRSEKKHTWTWLATGGRS